jgi:hypothetical protein
MAGSPLGASSPNSSPQRTLHIVPSSRTRRNHGVFVLGGHLACIYSARRASRCYGVSFEIGAGTLVVNGSMTAAQARGMARALAAAADAVDGAVRPAKPCRWGHDAEVVCPDCEVHHG